MCYSQIHYLLNLGTEINQRDDKGFTPLHRAAYLAQYDGYMEIYEYLMVRISLLLVSFSLLCTLGQPEYAKAGYKITGDTVMPSSGRLPVFLLPAMLYNMHISASVTAEPRRRPQHQDRELRPLSQPRAEAAHGRGPGGP